MIDYLILRLETYPQAGGTRPGIEVMHAIRKGQLGTLGNAAQTPAEQFYALAA
jgi:hypothetical protein